MTTPPIDGDRAEPAAKNSAKPLPRDSPAAPRRAARLLNLLLRREVEEGRAPKLVVGHPRGPKGRKVLVDGLVFFRLRQKRLSTATRPTT